MKSEKKKADQFEEDLQKEEKVLEGIRDSLKGIGLFFFLLDHGLTRLSDKTQVFHDQIEQKQKELQPWKTKFNQKQAEIDIKTSERDMLVQKAETIKQASAEAQETLEKLRGDQKTKVCLLTLLVYLSSDYAFRSGSSKPSNTGNSHSNKTRKLRTRLSRWDPL